MSNGTINDWRPYWQGDGFEAAAVSVCGVVWMLWFFLVSLHASRLRVLAVQASYLQLTLVFPVYCSLVAMATVIPSVAPCIDVIVGFLEGYIIFGFAALILALARQRNKNVYSIVGDDRYAKHCCAIKLLDLRFGKALAGPRALELLRGQIIQFWVVKPIVNLIQAIPEYVNNDHSKGINFLTGLVGAVSIIIALRALLVLYLTFRHHLVGMNLYAKFVVIKLIFLGIIINTLVLQRLLDSGAITVPAGLCPSGFENSALVCELRYLSFIQSLQCCAIFFVAVYLFSPGDFSDLPRLYGHCGILICHAFFAWEVLAHWGSAKDDPRVVGGSSRFVQKRNSDLEISSRGGAYQRNPMPGSEGAYLVTSV